MSDIDYYVLFTNGQLVWTVPEHREILDRFYRAYEGTPEHQIFPHKYKAYLAAVHPDALAPVVPPKAIVPDEVPEAAKTEPLSEVAPPEEVKEVLDEAEKPEEEEEPKQRKKNRRAIS